MMKLMILVIIYLLLPTRTRGAHICCPVAGCFNNSSPFDLLPLPQCAETMNIQMTVYTRSNPNVGQTISRSTIPQVYNGKLETMFIVHGWMTTIFDNWITTLKNAILQKENYNVIVVQWFGDSQTVWYPQPASNTRTIGAEIGLVAQNVIANAGATQSSLYCVGHSLGAHVCGHAGQTIKFGRITGLDPAGPMFQNQDWSIGLNPNCADLVDVIHTDGLASLPLGLTSGTLKILGNVDFYPNGGGNQPGCLLNTFDINDLMAVDLSPSCCHMRAISYYIESVMTPCFLTRLNCSDPNNLPSSCTSQTNPIQSMGFSSNEYPAKGVFYLETNRKSPFCKG